MLRIRSIKITERLVLNFILIGMGSVIIISYLSYRSLKSAILERTFEQLTAIRIINQSQVESFFNKRMSDAKIIADGQADLSNLSLGFLRKYGFYEGVLIIQNAKLRSFDFYGDSSNIQPIYSYKPYIDSILAFKYHDFSEPLILDFSKGRKKNSLVFFAVAPIIGSQGNEGYVALPVEVEAINTLMSDLAAKGGFGKSGEAYLVGHDYRMRSKSRFQEVSVLHTEVKTEASISAFSSGQGTQIVTDYRGIEVLSSFCQLRVNGIDWVLLSEIDFKEVMTPIVLVRNQILILSVLISLFIFLLALFISRRITKPILTLKKATAALSMGEFPTLQTEGVHDEIDELFIAFNDMSVSLREKQDLLNRERKRNLLAMIDGQESERKRLSLDLHDGLGQSLVAIKYRLECLDDKDPLLLAEILRQTKTEISNAIAETRNMSNDLMPAALSQFGLQPAIQQMCREIEKNSGIKIYFEADANTDAIDDRKKIYLYRIIQESITNTLKHSGAENLKIQMLQIRNDLLLLIEDDGSGLKDETPHCSSRGINSMKERVNVLNGVFEIRNGIEKGTIIQIRIPL